VIAPLPVAGPPPEPLSQEEQAGLLSELARTLTEDSRTARASGENARALSSARQAGAIFAALRRVTERDETTDPNVVVVQRSELDSEGVRFAEKVRLVALNIAAEKLTWPVCGACGHPVRPGRPGA